MQPEKMLLHLPGAVLERHPLRRCIAAGRCRLHGSIDFADVFARGFRVVSERRAESRFDWTWNVRTDSTYLHDKPPLWFGTFWPFYRSTRDRRPRISRSMGKRP